MTRSCGQINAELRMGRIPSVRSAVCGLNQQNWLRTTGERDHTEALMGWVTTTLFPG